jgi:DNA-binding PucR family transcriptional regulator
MTIAVSNLEQSLAELKLLGLLPIDPARLEGQSGAVARTLREAVLAEVPSFTASGNPEILVNLDQHASAHIREIIHILAGGAITGFSFVREHARLRAEQRFPLEATLHAYRCGHRIISHWLREAIASKKEKATSAIADFTLEYTNIISTIMASEYVLHARRQAEAEGDLRTELLNVLLTGYDESDGRVAQLLKRSGYLEQRQSYCVVVVQPLNAQEMEQPARAQRIIDALADALASTSIRLLAGARNMVVTAVLSHKRRQSGWTAPGEDLADRLVLLFDVLGPSVLIGLSASHPSTAFVPKALYEAKIALDFATVARRIVRFGDLPIRELLVHRGNDYVQSAPKPWVQALITANQDADGSLVATLRAMADSDMNVQLAGRQLGKHANTVYARLERIKALTGLDGQRYRDLTELLLAADCWRL